MYLKLIDNNKGMMAIYGPLLFVLAGTSLALGYFLFSSREQMKTKHQCRTLALESQQIIADAMNEILQMNTQALSLQDEEIIAKQKVAEATGNPYAMAAAMAYYKSVKVRQYMFKAQQQRIIRGATARANRHLRIGATRKQLTALESPPFLLQPYPPQSDSPAYRDYMGLSEEQTIRLTWNKHKNLNSKNLRFTGECKATLEKENEWHPILSADKDF